jgi:hypothetical protein
MIDNNKIYFFHNIYGEEQGLLDNLPENVIPIPFGWTEDAEKNRNTFIHSLGITVSYVPSVFAYVEEHYADNSFFPNMQFLPENDLRHQNSEQLVYSRWVGFDISSMPKPWVWTEIISKINNYNKL